MQAKSVNEESKGVPGTNKKWNFPGTQIIWVMAVVIVMFLIISPLIAIMGWSVYENGIVTFEHFSRVLSKPGVLQSIWNTISLSFGVTIVSVILGVLMAFGVSRTDMSWKKLAQSSVIITIITPPFLRTLSYVFLLGPNAGYINRLLRHVFMIGDSQGPLNIFSTVGLYFLVAPIGIAYVYIAAAPAFSQMDPALEESARVSGASLLRTVFNITLRVNKNAIFSGAMMAFTVTLGLFGTPYMLGTEVLTVSIRSALLMPLDLPAASILSILVIFLAMLSLLLYRRAIADYKQFQTVTGKGYRTGILNIGNWRYLFSSLGVIYGLLTFLFPYLMLVVISFLKNHGQGIGLDNLTLTNYKRVFTSSFTLQAIKNSTILAFSTATLCSLLGVIVAYLVVKTRIKGRGALDYISVLPMGIAGTALAVGVMGAYIAPPLRAFRVYGTLWILLITYLTKFMPITVRGNQSALMQVSDDLEESARIQGASWVKTITRITTPLIRASIVNGWVLVFLSSFSELSASIILRHINTNTVATAIIDLWNAVGGFEDAAALGSVVFLVVAVMFFIVNNRFGKSLFEND